MIFGFGKFTVRHKHARPGRNPRTREAITISARRVVTFNASNLFKTEINSPSAEGREGGKEGLLPKGK
ncbi:MAG: HU family DNA-binding protein [Nitrospira sp.]